VVLFIIYEAISGVDEACEISGLPVVLVLRLNPHTSSLSLLVGDS
jgi:hypothetical protein